MTRETEGVRGGYLPAGSSRTEWEGLSQVSRNRCTGPHTKGRANDSSSPGPGAGPCDCDDDDDDDDDDDADDDEEDDVG